MKKCIIGLVGRASGGKDTVAEYLQDTYGFTHVSTGNIVRDFVRNNNLGESTRDVLQTSANNLRKEYGADYLVITALKEASDTIVISGLRNPAEVLLLKKNGATIVAITTSLEVRYERAKSRKRIGDDISFEVFKQQELLEEKSKDPDTQNIQAVIALADICFTNDSTLKKLENKIDKFIADILKTSK